MTLKFLPAFRPAEPLMFSLALALKRPFAHETAVAEVGGKAAGGTECVADVVGWMLELCATTRVATAMAKSGDGDWWGRSVRSI